MGEEIRRILEEKGYNVDWIDENVTHNKSILILCSDSKESVVEIKRFLEERRLKVERYIHGKKILKETMEEMTRILEEKGCNVDWVDENAGYKWSYNAKSHIEDEKGYTLKPRSAQEIIDSIYLFKLAQQAKSFRLMFHELSEECYKKKVEDSSIVGVLYYDYI